MNKEKHEATLKMDLYLRYIYIDRFNKLEIIRYQKYLYIS